MFVLEKVMEGFARAAYGITVASGGINLRVMNPV
jgi:hypothetical protein